MNEQGSNLNKTPEISRRTMIAGIISAIICYFIMSYALYMYAGGGTYARDCEIPTIHVNGAYEFYQNPVFYFGGTEATINVSTYHELLQILNGYSVTGVSENNWVADRFIVTAFKGENEVTLYFDTDVPCRASFAVLTGVTMKTYPNSDTCCLSKGFGTQFMSLLSEADTVTEFGQKVYWVYTDESEDEPIKCWQLFRHPGQRGGTRLEIGYDRITGRCVYISSEYIDII